MTWATLPGTRRLTPAEAAAWEAQARAWQAGRLPLQGLRRPAVGKLYNPESGAETSIVLLLALYIGTTVASYYLVRGMAPKKSANSYGAGAAAANLVMPLVGPVAVGLMAANAPGKR